MNQEITKRIIREITELCGSHAHQQADSSQSAVIPVLAAIDGRCCSGKTTLAMQLSESLTKQGLSCCVIHMDDFFLRPEQRTRERLAEPGGNIDYERFTEEVLSPLTRGESFSYRPYSCRTQQLATPVLVKPTQVILIEGSYSCHPLFFSAWHLHIFMTIEKEEQLSRLEKRNGSAALPMFREKWIPLEEQYFQTFHIEEKCELVFNTTQYEAIHP